MTEKVRRKVEAREKPDRQVHPLWVAAGDALLPLGTTGAVMWGLEVSYPVLYAALAAGGAVALVRLATIRSPK